MNKIWLLDSGHGGIINGNYQTAPDKMYKHKDFVFYEGVYNRIIKNLLIEMFDNDSTVKYVDITASELDLDLDIRVDFANDIAKEYGANNCVYLSIHGNAGGGSGFEVWTSVGQTRSDIYADVWAKNVMVDFPEYQYRKDMSDGDYDKESMFYVLANTKCPALLTENNFYDVYKEAKKMLTPEFQYKVAKTHYNFVKESNNLPI